MKFYYVEKDYISYLKKYDSKIPNFDYDTHKKFVCGVVFNINNINYFAPISHNIDKYRSSYIIRNNNKPISSIRLSFMFPVDMKNLEIVNFSELKKEDYNYYRLVVSEYQICNKEKDKIKNKAERVYYNSQINNHILNKVCCDFKKLEEAMRNYSNDNKHEFDNTIDI